MTPHDANSTERDGMPQPALSRTRSRLRGVLLLAGALFFAWFVHHGWAETSIILREMNLLLFSAAIAVALVDNVLLSSLFRMLLRKEGIPLPYTDVGRMYFFGQIAKYIPGKIWNIFYHATFSAIPGATRSMLVANMDLLMLGMLRNLLIGAVLIAWTRHVPLALLLFLVGGLVFMQLASSSLVHVICSRLLRYFPGESPPRSATISRLAVAGIYVSSIPAFLLCNWLVLVAAFDFTTEQSLLYIAYFSIAWVAGVLSFLVPAGLGVREVVFVALASTSATPELPVAQLAAIAVVYRLWQVCHEIGGFGVGLALQFCKRKARPSGA